MKTLSKKPLIHQPSETIDCRFGAYTEIGPYSYLENVTLEAYSYACQFCIIQNTLIRSFSNIAAAVRIGPTMHPLDRITLHHFTYRRQQYGFDTCDDMRFFTERRNRITVIGHDTWIGHGAIIMPGVTVGHGAVIGSGAVVTKDIPPYSIAVGVPARPIKQRFSDTVAEALIRIAWWDWDHETIKARMSDFTGSAAAFIVKYDVEEREIDDTNA